MDMRVEKLLIEQRFCARVNYPCAKMQSWKRWHTNALERCFCLWKCAYGKQALMGWKGSRPLHVITWSRCPEDAMPNDSAVVLGMSTDQGQIGHAVGVEGLCAVEPASPFAQDRMDAPSRMQNISSSPWSLYKWAVPHPAVYLPPSITMVLSNSLTGYGSSWQATCQMPTLHPRPLMLLWCASDTAAKDSIKDIPMLWNF